MTDIDVTETHRSNGSRNGCDRLLPNKNRKKEQQVRLLLFFVSNYTGGKVCVEMIDLVIRSSA